MCGTDADVEYSAFILDQLKFVLNAEEKPYAPVDKIFKE